MSSRAVRSDSRPDHGRSFGWDAARWVGFVGILTIAVMRCAIAFAPQIWFDVDPAFDPTPWGGLGPAGSLLLDVLLLVACAVGLLGEWRSGRAVDWPLLVLAMAPLPIALWHGADDAGDLWRGSTLTAAAIACAVLAMLVRDRLMRAVGIGVLFGAIAVIFARGAAQVAYEHADTIQFFEQNKEQFFRARGWDPDSSAARIYERRLLQPQPLGWFTTTNIFGSLAASGVVFWIGLAIASLRARLSSGWTGIVALLAGAAAVALWFTGSMGAMLAAVIGLAVMGILIFGSWILDWRRAGAAHTSEDRSLPKAWLSVGGLVLVSLVAMALLVVVVRGALLPESFARDRSLLFRWHYLVASARIAAEHPLLGVGADGYQAAYMLHRLPRNPEEVVSAHSMFVDWICAFGITGAAWIAMTIMLLWRAGGALKESLPNTAGASGQACRAASIVAGIVIALGLIPALIIELPTFSDGAAMMVRILGTLGFAATAVSCAFIAAAGDRRLVAIALAGAVCALVVHGQIEMTFQQPGAVVWAFALLGVAGGAAAMRQTKFSSAVALAAVGVVATTLIWLTCAGLVPATRQERLVTQAAAMLAMPQPQAGPNAFVNQATLPARRKAAAQVLVQAYEAWPSNVLPLHAAAEQLALAAAEASRTAGPSSDRDPATLLAARDLAHRAARSHPTRASFVLVSNINAALATFTGDPVHWSAAIDAARQLTEMDPNGLVVWRRLADLLWASGERDQAVKAYQRALEIDDAFQLDAFKQLLEKDRELIRQRIASVQSSGSDQ